MKPDKINLLSVFLTLSVLALVASPVVGVNSTVVVDSQQIGLHETKLVIVSRHETVILNKFIDAFIKTDLASSVGITSADEIRIYQPSSYDSFYRAMTLDQIGADIGWGGGPTLFTSLALDPAGPAIGPITDQELIDLFNSVVNDSIAGASMKYYNDNNELLWVANAISSFGFTINKKVIADLGLPTPKSWADLASIEFYRPEKPTVALGNAPDTTSNTRIYQIILQKFGWEKGWEIIYRMGGNGAIFPGSVATRQQVIDGNVAAAMTIDFYGFIAQQENSNTQYVVPANESIVNGDPVALAVNPPHFEAAKAFLKFIFSQEGQALWLDPEINRLPIRSDAFDTPLGQTRQDIYAVYNQTIRTPGIVFDEDKALSLEEAMRYHFEATLTDVHDDMRTIWGILVERLQSGNLTEDQFNAEVKKYAQPAITEKEAQQINEKIIEDLNYRAQKQEEWKNFKLDKIKEIYDDLGIPYGGAGTGGNVKQFPGFTTTMTIITLLFVAVSAILLRKKKILR